MILAETIIQRLRSSPLWCDKTKESGEYISELKCPACGEPEAYTWREKPFALVCNRKNQCGAQTSYRELFPDLLTNVEKDHPPTANDPIRPARRYVELRGLKRSLEGVSLRYDTNIRGTGSGGVMFLVGEKNGKQVWNGRIFNPGKEKKGHTEGPYKGLFWRHPLFVYDSEAETFVVEGIIDALSLIEMGFQAIAIISAGVKPDSLDLSEFEKLVFAFDPGEAGSKALKKWKKKYPSAGAVIPTKGDWNDLLRDNLPSDKAAEVFKEKRQEFEENARLVLEGVSTAGGDNGECVINIECVSLSEMTEKTWGALILKNEPPSLFNCSFGPGRLVTGEAGEPIIQELKPAKVRFHADQAVKFIKTKKINGSITDVPACPPIALFENILADPAPRFPRLARIIQAPIYTKDGLLHSKPGYDPQTRMFYHMVDPKMEIPAVSELEAYDLIDELFEDFPFDSDDGNASRANAIALVFLPFVREMIDAPIPLFLFDAPTAGTGKTLCAQTCTLPFLGYSCPLTTEAPTEEEWRKLILAKLQTYPSIILIDNVTRQLGSAAINALTTSRFYEDRILGGSNLGTFKNSSIWVITGNNLSLTTEITRRSIHIRLDTCMDRPWERASASFKHPDILGWASQNRGRLIGAILKMIEIWIAEGRPMASSPIIGGLEQFSGIMGGILQANCIRGFLGNVKKFHDTADAEGAILRTFVDAWWKKHGEQTVGVAELYDIVIKQDIPLPLGRSDSERGQKTSLGKKIGKMRNRIFDGIKVIPAGTEKRAGQWRLEKK